ncbi:hypothetical protein RFI_05041 [Reticulomyxa filosa]|uniref:Calcineurin-like phosphoesterase domain-containing protein n=1 Tax=Reticulomyxa filosa TaxID=46433 RepID=X6P0I8_RETFI|nr:hypothetical protein RFI_05041 [Reticulomyxa filosa]|eukprot:ETO32075.1 hypothetical protein RFI_05041 [Reticulomyxa filosa]
MKAKYTNLVMFWQHENSVRFQGKKVFSRGSRCKKQRETMLASICFLSSIAGIHTVFGAGLDFLLMADWGGQSDSPYYTTDEQNTAHIMGDIASDIPITAVFGIGDNFYDDGVASATDPRFQLSFEEYSVLYDCWKSRMRHFCAHFVCVRFFFFKFKILNPVYATLFKKNQKKKAKGGLKKKLAHNYIKIGDCPNRVQQCMKYFVVQCFFVEHSSKEFSSRWKYPDYWYSVTWTIPDTSPARTIEMIMIDTVILCGDQQDLEYCERHNIALSDCKINMTGPTHPSAANDQWDWIKQQLQQSTADFLIVSGHYPVYSIGGNGPTSCLVDQLEPWLLKYNVTAYVAGHDHMFEYINVPGQYVGYVVTGGAHECSNSTKHEVPVLCLQSKYLNKKTFLFFLLFFFWIKFFFAFFFFPFGSCLHLVQLFHLNLFYVKKLFDSFENLFISFK